MIYPLFLVLTGFIRLGWRVLTWRSQLVDYPCPTAASARTAAVLVACCQFALMISFSTLWQALTSALLSYGVIWYVGRKHGLSKSMAIAALTLIYALIDLATKALPGGLGGLVLLGLLSAYFLAFFRVLTQKSEVSE
ncbi:hypothetical protein [Geopseudomonas aromaticivorans]